MKSVKKNTDGTIDVTVDKPLIEQVAIKTNERIIIRFIATSQSEINSQYGASESMLTGKGYQANILKNNAFSGYATNSFFYGSDNVLLLKLNYPSFIKGRTYVPAHNICGFIFGSGKDDIGNENPNNYVTKGEYTIIDIITKSEYKGTLETGLSPTKSYSEVFLPNTYSTDEVKLIIKEYSGKPIIKVGLMYDFIKNTLNNKHSFDFLDKDKLHWDVNSKLDNCMDTLYGVEPVGRENALDWDRIPIREVCASRVF